MGPSTTRLLPIAELSRSSSGGHCGQEDGGHSNVRAWPIVGVQAGVAADISTEDCCRSRVSEQSFIRVCHTADTEEGHGKKFVTGGPKRELDLCLARI